MSIELISNIITIVFFLVILSYYILVFLPKKNRKEEEKFSSISIIIPAHNEERYLKKCLESVVKARFDGKKEIILVDDASEDNTVNIARKFPVKIIKLKKHSGKAHALNTGIDKSKANLIAVVDADSTIDRGSLIEMTKIISQKNTGAVCGVIKVKNRKKFLGMWLHIEQLYNSLVRMLFSKINANIVTPGPLSVYRRDALKKINGFSTKGFSEDVDVSIRLVRAGYKIGFSEKSVSETNMPVSFKGFYHQRTRFAKGWLNIFSKHLSLNSTIIDLYSLPLMLFSYVQAVIMSVITLINLFSGYLTYFYSKGIIFNFGVLNYFVDWLSIIGTVKWLINIIAGNTPLTAFVLISLGASLLSYPLYLVSILKYDKKFTIYHLVPLFFMFPFWLMIMVIYTINLPEVFNKNQINRWVKYN